MNDNLPFRMDTMPKPFSKRVSITFPEFQGEGSTMPVSVALVGRIDAQYRVVDELYRSQCIPYLRGVKNTDA